MIQSLHYQLIADATTEFLALARQYHFCEDHLDDIERRLYEESPFKGTSAAINRKGGRSHESIH